MSAPMAIGGTPVNFTASGNKSPIPCTVIGVLCSTTTSGTFQIYDDASTGTSTPVTGVVTPAAGSFTPLYATLSKGCNIVVGATINATVILSY